MSNRRLTTDEIQDVIAELDRYLIDLKARWDQENPGNHSWWKVTQTYLVKATIFIINILDELITFVEKIIPAGDDKKAAVMTMVTKLFDYIVVQAFPFWLKPFASIIKDIILNVIIGKLIDYIVEKYNAGYWNMEDTTDGETTEDTEK